MARSGDEVQFTQLPAEPVDVEVGRAGLYTRTDGSVHLKRGSSDSQLYPAPSTGPDFQVFRTAGSFTWTKPAGARWVEVILVGGGGGGGSGMVGAAATVRNGGAGGSPGLRTRFIINADDLPATVAVTVGAGGGGGATPGAGARG